jgi:hypothetical protein
VKDAPPASFIKRPQLVTYGDKVLDTVRDIRFILLVVSLPKTQTNPYPGYPGPLGRKYQSLLLKRLADVLQEHPPDARQLEDLWRILVEGKGRRIKLPKRRFRGTRG